jgi:hypothetical protein
MKTLPLLIALTAGIAFAHDWTIEVGYNYNGEFTVVNPADWTWIAPSDTVTYHTDDPGTLILRTDDGAIYESQTGGITFTADQIVKTKIVRCSMTTPDGRLLGWEVDHDSAYGDGTPPGLQDLIAAVLWWLRH